jgi:four helix bundle protein
MAIQSFRQLRVYERSVDLRKRIFEMSKSWPVEERYSLIDQIRRSSRSVSATLAEAWSKRRFERHFVSKLTDVHGEAAETSVWLDIALECGYLAAEDHGQVMAWCDEIAGGLVKMMRESHKWVVPDHLARDPDVDYSAVASGPDADDSPAASDPDDDYAAAAFDPEF